MAVDVERLVAEQRQAIAGFFNTEIPAPSDRLFEVAEINRQEKLFDDPIILYALRRSFPEGVTFPGQRVPMGPVLYRYMSENLVDADANCLPGAWIMFDSTQRPDYDKGRQMYPDTTRFRQVLASVRAEHPEISEHSYHIPPDSRFYFASGEIDGRGWEYITTKVANILKLQPGEEITTPPYAVFYYVGNLYPRLKLGDASTSEWFRDRVGNGGGYRLIGGCSTHGGLTDVRSWEFGRYNAHIGFRLQISFPSKA